MNTTINNIPDYNLDTWGMTGLTDEMDDYYECVDSVSGIYYSPDAYWKTYIPLIVYLYIGLSYMRPITILENR